MAATHGWKAAPRVDRHDSALGSWELARVDPWPALAPYVHELQGYVEHAPQRIRRREMPSDRVALILDLGPGWRMIDPRDGSLLADRGSFVAGLHESHAIVDSDGEAFCMQIDFTPLGAYRFFAVPMHELAGVTTELGDIQGAAIDRLRERIYEAPDWDARFTLLQEFVRARIEAAREPSPGVVWAWQQLQRTHGGSTIRELASELGWSRVRLARQFREQVGLPPKTLAQVLRFDRVLGLLPARSRGDLADLAALCGYADQSHMNKEFRRFSGWSPSEYLRHQTPGGGAIEP